MSLNKMKLNELKLLAKEYNLKGYSHLNKADLINLISNAEKEKQMDIFEKEEMSKSRPQIKSKLNEWRDWLVNHIPESIKNVADENFKTLKNKIMMLYKKDKDDKPEIVDNHDKHTPFVPIEVAFDKVYKRFKIYNDDTKISYTDFFRKIRKHLFNVIKKQLEDLKSMKIQTTIWINFHKEGENGEVTNIELAFNSKLTEIFEGSNLKNILNEMISHMKSQIENPKLLDSKFKFNKVIYLDIDFHKLNLTRGSSYIPLPKQIADKKAIINPKNENDEECFKWAVIASLHHEDIEKDPTKNI